MAYTTGTAAQARRRARRIKVSPVTQAIRGILAVSAASLALAGPALAADHGCAGGPSLLFCDTLALHQAAQAPVIDLTTVADDFRPDSVIGLTHGWSDSFIAQPADIAGGETPAFGPMAASSEPSFAASDAQGFGAVQDMTLVPGGGGMTLFPGGGGVLMPGPGGVAGGGDAIGVDLSGIPYGNWYIFGGAASASSATGYADGFFFGAAAGNVISWDQNGDVSATGYTWAAGLEIEAATYANNISLNAGYTIDATATGDYGQAWGIYAVAPDSVSMANAGDIFVEANGAYGTAAGLFAYAATGTASADNTGYIDVGAYGYYASGWGISAVGFYGATVTNSGTVYVYGNDEAFGLSASAYYGDSSVTNSGNVDVFGMYGNATAVQATSYYGNASIDNSGYASAYSIYGDAIGLYGGSYGGTVGITNSGYADATSYFDNAGAIVAYSGYGNITVTNSGNADAVTRYGNAYGTLAYSGFGDISIDNSGSATAYSHFGNAIALYGYSYGGNVSITNSGYAGAYSYYGLADGIFASGINVDVTNTATGSIYAYGYDWAAGIEAQGDLTTVVNDGSIYAKTYAAGGYAFGVYATGGAGGVSVTTGVGSSIEAQGYYTYGIYVDSAGPVTITNGGDITSGALTSYTDPYGNTTYYGTAVATGIHASTTDPASDITVSNSGNISAVGYFGGTGIEVLATGQGSSGSVTNTGDVYASGHTKYDYGAAGIVVSADGDASIDNQGAITAVSGGAAYGALALSFAGDASVTNTGDINVYSNDSFKYYSAYGVVAAAANGYASVDNSGTINAVSQKYNGYSYHAFGVVAQGLDGAAVTNSGSITANGWVSYGIQASSGDGDVSVTNTSTGSVRSYYGAGGSGYAFGIFGQSTNGDVSIDNAGYAYAYAGQQAVGLFGLSTYGDVSVSNSGQALGYSYGVAVGIFERANAGTATVDNSGVAGAVSYAGSAAGIRAIAETVDVTNTGTAVGISYYGDTTGIGAYGDTGTVTVVNDYVAGAVSKYSGNATGIYAVSGGDVSVTTGTSSQTIAQAPYGYATGIFAASIAGDVTVGNGGYVGASSYYDADGINVIAVAGNAGVVNSGTVYADSYYIAIGIYASGYAGTAVDNSGTVIAHSGDDQALGIVAVSDAGNSSVSNSGTVVADADYGTAMGVLAQAYGDALVDGAGTVVASGYGDALGIYAYAHYGNATVASGNVYATAQYGDANGIVADAKYGNSTVTSTGNLVAVAPYGFAQGIIAYAYGDAGVDNSGTVAAIGYYGALGIAASADTGDATAVNSGTVAADADYGNATGVLAQAYGDALVDNAGTIIANGYYGANGIVAYVLTGDATVVSSGTVAATTTDGAAFATVAYSYLGDVSIDNSGSQTASSTYGSAIAMYGYAYAGNVNVNNSGYAGAYSYTGLADGIFASGTNVDVTNTTTGSIYANGVGWSVGIEAQGGDLTTVVNDGSVYAYVYGAGGYAFGIYATGGAGGVTVNTGAGSSIQAQGYYTYGIYVDSAGPVTVTSDGDITSGTLTSYTDPYGYTTLYGTALATGIHASTNYPAADITVSNSGNISAEGYYGGTGIEVLATGLGSNGYASNSGTIHALEGGALYGGAGIVVAADNNAGIDNSGSIDASSMGSKYAYAYGALALAFTGDATVTNSGDISAYSAGIMYSGAYGIVAAAQNGNAYVNTSGSIDATSGKYAMGVQAAGLTGTTVVNSGSILADGKYAYGINAVSGAGDVSVDSSGAIEAYSYAGYGTGVFALATTGDVSVGNSGSIDVYGFSQAVGVFARTSAGDIGVDSSGAIDAYSLGGTAAGIFADAYANATISNSGAVDALAGYYSAYGILTFGQTLDVTNSGAITATGGYYGTAQGIYANGVDAATVASSGSISATSTGPYGPAIGIHANSGGDVGVSNSGAITATGQAYAFGVYATSANGLVSVSNAGDIQADASDTNATGIYGGALYGDVALTNATGGTVSAYSANGTAMALAGASYYGNVSASNAGVLDAYANLGSIAVGMLGNTLSAGGGDVSLTNAAGGAISALANTGTANGVMALSYYGAISIANAGDIAASGYDTAGIYAASIAGAASIGNSGSIEATANGAGNTYGVHAMSGGPLTIDNSGSIVVTDDDYAVGVSMYSATLSTLYNSGSIRTYAPDEAQIAVLGSDGVEAIINAGDLYGAIVAGAGNDVFAGYSGGYWYVGNHSTDFGGGDDELHNLAGSTIQLTDGAIYLGSSTAAGNMFENSGTIAVSGSGLIDMGSGISATPGAAIPVLGGQVFAVAAVPSLNAQAFVNNGLIDFVDGVPDDVLTVVGDLGGSGALSLDVSAITGSSDVLYVDGSTTGGTAQSVNAAVDGFVTPDMAPIPFAYVTGDGADGAFVEGNVLSTSSAADFVTLGLDVISTIDTSNATPDVFSLAVAVDGLNDGGAFAASIAPGVHSLANSGIGTWHQRVGVMPTLDDGRVGLSPWLRVFSDEGGVAPAYSADFGSPQQLGFDQDNWGRELGMNFTVGNGIHYGVLLGKSDGTQHMHDYTGTSRIRMHTAGLYATWIAPKFYFDVSYRWMDFDATLTTIAGDQTSSGNATAFNAEAGWTAWTVGGWNIVPQAQYTRTNITDVSPVAGDSVDFNIDGGTSERGRLGVGLNKAFTSASGVIWTPYGSINAVREFDGSNGFDIAGLYHGSTDTEGTSAMLELGVGMQVKGFSATAGVNWTDGGAQDSFLGGQLVLRYTW